MVTPSLSLPASGRFLIGVFVFFVFLLLSAGGYYFYLQYQKTQKMLESPTDAVKEQVNSVVAAVGKLILLPDDEEPTLATVSDKTKLQSQAFFAEAENGDQVLIYPKAKKAYLYRPKLNKLVDVAPANIGTAIAPSPVTVAISPTVFPSVSPKPTGKSLVTPPLTPTPTSVFKPVNVALYNGTKTGGLAATVATKLKIQMSSATVVLKANAADNYTESLVIDFTGKFPKEAASLAKLTNGSVGVLPKLETKPTADILVILGPQ